MNYWLICTEPWEFAKDLRFSDRTQLAWILMSQSYELSRVRLDKVKSTLRLKGQPDVKPLIEQGYIEVWDDNDQPVDYETAAESIKRKQRKERWLPHNDDAFRHTWENFREHRRKRGAPMSPLAESRILKQLQGYDAGTAVEMLEQSIRRNWIGVFEVRSQPKPSLSRGWQQWS